MSQDDAIDIITRRLSEAAPDEAGFALADLLLELLRNDFPSHDNKQKNDLCGPEKLHSQTVFVGFVVKAFDGCEKDPIRLDRLARLCAQSKFLLNTALTGLEIVVLQALTLFAEQDGFAVPVAQGSEATSLNTTLSILDESPTANAGGTNFDISINTCLAFLKTILHQRPSHALSVPPRWIIFLTLLAGARDRNVSISAKQIVIVLLSASYLQIDQSQIADYEEQCISLRPLLWQQVFEFTDHLGEPHYTNIGLSLWLRLLPLSQTPWRSDQFLVGDSYWRIIHLFLGSGSPEQRKLSLAILRQSLMLLTRSIDCPYMKYEPEKASQYQAHYEKYATIFEIVILARYLNQVQECIPELGFLCSDTSLVHPSWIVTLLHASLLHGMQDSIRNILGPWILRHAPPILGSTVNGVDFLEHAFLSWATLGYHFTPVFNPSTARPSCPFGENLAVFISRTIILAEDRSKVIAALLRFIADREERILSFSRAFVLDGLIGGIGDTSTELEPHHIVLLTRIAQHQGFQVVVRDLMVLQTSELLFGLGQVDSQMNLSLASSRNSVLSSSERGSNEKYIDAKEFFFDDVRKYPTSLEMPLDGLVDESLLETNPLGQLYAWIQHSNRLCLAGPGLRAASDLLQVVLETNPISQPKAVCLTGVLEALWDEAERREYPRAIMVKFPGIILHWRFIKLLSFDHKFRNTVQKLVQNLMSMAKNKVYLFSTLATVMRGAVLSVEESQYLPLANIVTTYVMEPPRAGVEFQLERVMSQWLEKRAPGKNYELYYGKPEEYGHACMFDMLNSLPISDEWDACFGEILDSILEVWINQKQPVPIFSGWKTTVQLQVMLLALERLTPKLPRDRVKEYLNKLFSILQLEPLPRFRYLLEWMIIRIYVNVPKRRQDLLETLAAPTFIGDINNPKYTVSVIKVSLAVACLPAIDESYALQVMAALNVLAASSKVAVRHEAQWAFPKIWTHAWKSGWDKATANIAFARLNDYITRLDTFKTPPASRLLEEFDPIADHNLTYLLQGEYLMIDPCERPLVTRQEIISVRADSTEKASTELMALVDTKRVYKDRFAVTDQQLLELEQNNITVVPLQTKSTVTDVEKLNDEHKRQSTNVIVVASLIDSPYNLGGIARVSEIFGVKALKLKNRGVTKNKEFTSVSVASHLWFPVEELKVPQIAEFLTQCKADGYTVVGIEQTDSSQVLGRPDCQLPKNAVFVLGSEKEGISAELLAEIDLCVEISQAGVTRSLNVQTALSVALYEHQRQHK